MTQHRAPFGVYGLDIRGLLQFPDLGLVLTQDAIGHVCFDLCDSRLRELRERHAAPWRLPTLGELNAIAARTAYTQMLPIIPGMLLDNGDVWTSTRHALDSDQLYRFNLGTGVVSYGPRQDMLPMIAVYSR